MRGEKNVLTKSEAFDVMRWFLEMYWERGERSSDDIAVLLGSINRGGENYMPLDPAQWHYWNDACDHVLNNEGGHL